MQRSKLVDDLHILIPPVYEGKDISNATVMVEYILPISREYTPEVLNKSDDLYKGHLEYKLPFDTQLTKEHGDIEIQVTMMMVEMDFTGKVAQWVRKTTPTTITITPLSAWSNQIADVNLTQLDQRLIQMQMQTEALADMALALDMNKADDLSYVDNELQLMSCGRKIGTKVKIDCLAEDGIPIVDFGAAGSDTDPEEGFDAVLF